MPRSLIRVLLTGKICISFVQLSILSSVFVQVMEWIPGTSGDSFKFKQHFAGELSDPAKQVLKELGRLMAFDIIFNNEDRFLLEKSSLTGAATWETSSSKNKEDL